MYSGAFVDASAFGQALLPVSLAGPGVLASAFRFASSQAFDPTLFSCCSGGSLSGVRGAFHPLDGLGEELLLADLSRFGVLCLVLESIEDPLGRASGVGRLGDLGPEFRGLHRVAYAAHDEACLLTSAGGASATGKSVAILERVKC